MKLRDRKRPDYMVDITPLVDVVFLMLIFFMVSTSFNVASALKLELPSSHSREQTQELDEVVVSINPEGQFFVQSETVSDADLRRRILNATKGDPNKRIVLRADAEARHKRVVFVLDVLREIGMGKVAISTVPATESP
ncbi:MAG: biopolymer transporter ExbD [Mariprofundaceae bacterium]